MLAHGVDILIVSCVLRALFYVSFNPGIILKSLVRLQGQNFYSYTIRILCCFRSARLLRRLQNQEYPLLQLIASIKISVEGITTDFEAGSSGRLYGIYLEEQRAFLNFRTSYYN